jgi:hypothetical protein
MGTADNRKMRSPQTTGDADPRPGSSTFQRTFFASLHSSGGFAYFETPVAYGPRHCGQKRSAAVALSPLWRAGTPSAPWRAAGSGAALKAIIKPSIKLIAQVVRAVKMFSTYRVDG